jgi:hypothetical protein
MFSGLRASFVKRQAFKPFNRCAPFKPFKPTSALRVQSSNTLYPAAVKSILDFRFRPNQRLNLEITSRCGPLFFCSSSPQQNSDCQPQLLPTTVRLAPTTHPGERSLSVGDELVESPLVSKSRTTQIVPVSRNALRWPDLMTCTPAAVLYRPRAVFIGI